MKKEPSVMDQRTQTRILDWLYQQVEGEDDFLMGKTPQDLSDTWEEEE